MRPASRAVNPLVVPAPASLPDLPVVQAVSFAPSRASLHQELQYLKSLNKELLLMFITEFAGGKVDPVEAGRKGGKSSN